MTVKAEYAKSAVRFEYANLMEQETRNKNR